MSNNRTKLYKYADLVVKAKIDCKAKALLWFYAYTYNWDKGLPSYWPQRKICALVGMSSSTFIVKRNYLEELGWINVKHRGWKLPCKVGVLIGKDDSDYDTKSWAAWHPSNQILTDNLNGDSERDPEFSMTIEKQFQELDSKNAVNLIESDNNPDGESKRFVRDMDWFG